MVLLQGNYVSPKKLRKNYVETSWAKKGTAGTLNEVESKLSTMQQDLTIWASKDFGSIVKQTAEIRKRLSNLWKEP